VFVADEDYRFYLENLLECKKALAIKVYGWCLMTNHIHLIVEPVAEPESLSLLMKRLSGRQAAYTNQWGQSHSIRINGVKSMGSNQWGQGQSY